MPDTKYRTERARELEELAILLTTEGVCTDPGPLNAAAKTCRDPIHTGCWYYNITGLILHVGDDVKCVPDHVLTFSCRLDVEVGGRCKVPDERSDPLKWQAVQFELKAPNAARVDVPFVQTWHFDRHDGDCSAPRPSHPRYHFSFGGRAFENHLNSFGQTLLDGLLLLDTPRLTHPPFDGVLAVDFVLANFAGSRWRNLCTDAVYRRILRDAQKRLWMPYARALNAHWDHDIARKKIWPIGELWPPVLSDE